VAQIYDLAHDPGERNDLMHQPEQKKRIRELARLILAWSENTDDAVGAQFARRYA
jgi:hypothetical protein